MATGYGDMTSMRDSAMDWVGSWAGRVYDAEHALEKARERLSEEMDNNRRLHKELAAAEERVQTYENGIRWANLRGELAKANRERDEAEAKLTTESERWNSVYLQEALQAQKERDEAVARAEKAEDKLAAGSKRWDNFIAMAPIGVARAVKAEKNLNESHKRQLRYRQERDEAREEAEMWKGKWNGLQTRPPDDTGVHYSGGGLWSGCTKSRTVDAPAVEPQPEDERTPGRVRRLIPRQNRNMNLSDRRTSDPLASKGRAARKDHQQ